MTDIIIDTSLPNAFQQEPLKVVQQQCNNNTKLPLSDSAALPTTPTLLVVPKSKLIISNMESVIRSVKKQHVVKKKKRKIVEPEISDISTILTNSLTFVSPNVSNSEEKTTLINEMNGTQSQGTEKCYSPCSNSSKENQSTPASSLANSPTSGSESSKGTTMKTKSLTSSSNINLNHSTPKVTESPKNPVTESTPTTSKEPKATTKTTSTITKPDRSTKTAKPKTQTKNIKKSSKTPMKTSSPLTPTTSLPTADNQSSETPKKNAFLVMMSARSNVIGSNSSGKLQIDPSQSLQSNGISAEKSKRKVLLEEWADRKGAGKRKLIETETEACVDRKMNKRAKRLKNLLSNGKKRKKSSELVDSDDDRIESDASNNSIEEIKTAGTKRRRIVNQIADSTSDEDDDNDCCIVSEENVKESNSSKNITDTTPIIVADKNTPTATTKSVKKVTPKSANGFVNGLSSPVKKRDSLLGYFSKLKPEEEKMTESVKTPKEKSPVVVEVKKKRGRPKKLPQEPVINDDSSSVELVTEIIRECTPPPSTPTESFVETDGGVRQRPKRECRNNHPGYKYDIEISPAKVAAKKSIKLAKRRLSGSPKNKITTSHYKSPIKMKQKAFDRLAPIFVKSTPKPVIDPAVAKARQLFLMSGIPECMRLEIDKQRAYEETFAEEIEFFPSISHVQQLSTNDDEVTVINLKFRQNDDENDEDTFELIVNGKFECGGRIKEQVKIVDEKMCEKSFSNAKQLIKQLKLNDSKFQYNRCYKQLSTKFHNSKESTIEEDIDPVSCHIDDSIEIITPNDVCTSADTTKMFIDQYKPTALNEIFVNYQPANELKKFLVKWMETGNNVRSRNYDDSSDDFTDSQSNSLSSIYCSKSIILVGPSGCGKTNAVYAIAKELKFKVLEINASNLRTGKKLFKKLHEATQSHQVKSQNNNSQKLDANDSEELNIFANNNDNNDDDNRWPALILIEDADVVFEQDFGFIDAIQQLITVTKRPVILIANQRNCSHLQKFMAQNLIEFSPAKCATISKWLATLSIVELCFITIDECSRLYLHNNHDLRKTLLEMQFFIQSEIYLRSNNDDADDKVLLPKKSIIDFYENDQNVVGNEIIPVPLNLTSLREQTKNMYDTESMDTIMNFYENITCADRLNCITEIDEYDNCYGKNTNKNIAHDIACKTMQQHAKVNQLKRSTETTNSAKKVLSLDLITNVLSTKRSIYLDYEPCLRTICRTEKVRTQTERRGSRFYHYLRHMKLGANSFNTNLFDEYSTIFDIDLNNLDDGNVNKET